MTVGLCVDVPFSLQEQMMSNDTEINDISFAALVQEIRNLKRPFAWVAIHCSDLDDSFMERVKWLHAHVATAALIVIADDTRNDLALLLEHGAHAFVRSLDLSPPLWQDVLTLARSNKQQAMQRDILTHMLQANAESLQFHNVVMTIVRHIGHVFSLPSGEIWAFDETASELRRVVKWYDAELITDSAASSEALAEVALSHVEAAWLPDWRAHLGGPTSHLACLCVPIRLHDRVLGTILFYAPSSLTLHHLEWQTLTWLGARFAELMMQNRIQNNLLYLAEHDDLTQLANRTALLHYMKQAFLDTEHARAMLAFLYIDLDHFKHFNDTKGHSAGDEVLRRIAWSLKGCVRKTDLLARLGGDEFVVVLPAIQSIDDASSLAKKIVHSIHAVQLTDRTDIAISASIGISVYPYHGSSFNELLKAADQALYEAKRHGGHHFVISPYDQEEDSKTKRLQMLERLQSPRFWEELSLQYQLIARVSDHVPVGVECLLRWHFNDNEVLSPDDFLSYAGELGMLSLIGEWVILRAMQEWVDFAARHSSQFKLVVNITASEFSRDFYLHVQHAIKTTQFPANCLTLELTEHYLLASDQYHLDILQALRDLSIKFSIDDFGVGYSSFAYLNQFQIDALKIDRTFVETMLDQVSARAIVSALIAMAHTLQLQVIAEGVEKEEQRVFLAKQGCEFYQGYLKARPLSASDCLALFR